MIGRGLPPAPPPCPHPPVSKRRGPPTQAVRGWKSSLSSKDPPLVQQQRSLPTETRPGRALLSGVALRYWLGLGVKALFNTFSRGLQACAAKHRGPCSAVLSGQL